MYVQPDRHHQLRGLAAPAAHQVGRIPGGDAGTRATVRQMAQLANAGQVRPCLIQIAQRVVGHAGATPAAQIAAIREFLESRVHFVRDPVEVEAIKEPCEMLDEIVHLGGYSYGDCDDIATLGAALGKAVGFPARFVVEGYDQDGPFQHVYAELADPSSGTWHQLDTSRELQGFPEGLPAARRFTHTV